MNKTFATSFWTMLVAALVGAQGAAAAQEPSRVRPVDPDRPSPSRPADPDQRSTEHEEDGDVNARDQWFYGQRAYPQKRIPAGVRLRAWRDFKAMQAGEAEAAQGMGDFFSASNSTYSQAPWHPIGPQPITPTNPEMIFNGFPSDSGRVHALAVDPTNPQIVYLGSAGGGVWKTTNGGKNWTPLTDKQPSLAVGSIAIDPTNHNIIYVGTGEQVPMIGEVGNQGSNYYGAGVLKSTNGGSTWTLYGFVHSGPLGPSECEGGVYIGALSVSPANNQDMLAAVTFPGADGCEEASESGIYRSTNGGVTWSAVLTGAAGTAVQFLPNPYGSYAWAALGDPAGSASNGLYSSTNGGATWTPDYSFPVPGYLAGWITLAVTPSDPLGLYVDVADPTTNSSANEALIVSGDGGETWFPTNAPDYCNPQCWYDNVLAVAPNNANVIYAGGAFQYNNSAGEQALAVISSVNGGYSWNYVELGANGPNATQCTTGCVHTDVHALAFSSDGSTLYVGSDGGAWSTTDVTSPTPKWTGLNSTLATTTFYPGVSVSPSNPNYGFAGAQDNGTQQYGGGVSWGNVTCGDGGFTAIDPSNPDVAYAACAAGAGIFKTTSGGANGWGSGPVTTGIDSQDRALFVMPMTMDPSNPQNLYYGTYRVYQTTNGAGSWKAISPDLSTGAGFVSAIAVAPGSSSTVYAGTSDSQVWVIKNALPGPSYTWHNISAGLPSRWITWIAVDRSSPATVYVTFSGFSGFSDDQGHVFKSTNQGASWADISGNLPNVPVNQILIDPGLRNTYYIATDVGVFSTTNGGASWSTFSSGLPNVPVTGLALQQSTRSLRAVTFGRGAWDVALPPSEVMVSLALGDDYTGAGQADFAVWRASTGTFYVDPQSGASQSKVWGLPGDVILNGDYDADGKTDYAVWRPSTGTWHISLSSSGKSVTQVWGEAGDVPAPGDYDGDGKTDCAVWRPSDATFHVILSSTGKTLTQLWGAVGDIPLPGDYDGDGKTDFAVWRPSTGTFYVLLSGSGTTVAQRYGVSGDLPVPNDFDGDGKTDFALWRPSTATFYVMLSTTGGTVSRQYGVPGDIPVVNDYDGDGKADYAVWRPSNGTWYVIYSSTGQSMNRQYGEPGDSPACTLPLQVRRNKHVSNFDGDQKTDIAVWRPSHGTWHAIDSSTGTSWTQAYGLSGDIPVPGDYDGDGKTDYAVFRPSTAIWFVILSSTGKAVTQAYGANGDIAVPADYDGDGKTDYAVFRPSTATWYVMLSSTGASVHQQFGASGDIPVPGDYDGDARADYTVFRPSNGTWHTLQSSNGKTRTTAFGAKGDIPVAKDYDGDEKTDIAVWRPSSGKWYILQSSSGVETTTQWGLSTDVPVNKPTGQ